MKRITLVALAVVSLIVFSGPVRAFADGPAATPMAVLSEGFELDSVQYSTGPSLLDGMSVVDYWARVSTAMGGRARTGSWGLWCDGTDSGAITGNGVWSTVPLTYNPYSGGTARFDLPQVADLYSSSVDFWYNLPSRGTADALSFNVLTSPSADLLDTRSHAVFALTASGSWTHSIIPIEDYLAKPVSGTSATVRFNWVDNLLDTDPASVGQGPTIDDVSVTGWRFGPVRNLTAVATNGSVTLTWGKPLRSPAPAAVEERPISYRVWRAPAGTPIASSASWTPLTSTHPANASPTVQLSDTTTAVGTRYTYLVQPWEPDAGTGYGEARTVDVTTPGGGSTPPPVPTTPAVSFTSPTNGAVIAATTPISVRGNVSPAANAVTLTITRSDGAWILWPVAVTVDAMGAWSYAWQPPSSETSGYTLRAASGQSVSVVTVNVDSTVPPVVVPVATSLSPLTGPSSGAYGARVTLGGALRSASGAALAGKPVTVQYSYDNVHWSTLSGGVSWSASGGFAKYVYPTRRTYYRAHFAGDGTAGPSVSAVKAVLPRVSLSAPSAPASARRLRAFSSSGYLKPYHAAAAVSQVTIQCYRYERQRNGRYKWILRRNVATRALRYSSATTKYAGSVRLPYAGRWAIRAYHRTDTLNAATTTAFHYLTVK